MAKHHYSTLAQKIAIQDLLKDTLAEVPNTPFWAYQNGWTDIKIAAEVGGNIQSKHVLYVRHTLFGLFPPRAKKEAQPVCWSDGAGAEVLDHAIVKHLRDQLAALRSDFTTLLDSHNRLLSEFGLLPIEFG